jgi:hypothetical protein
MLIFIFAFIIFLAGALTASPDAQQAAAYIAGMIAPILTQMLKQYMGLRGRWAFALSLAVCLAIAILSLVVSGEIHSPNDVLKSGLQVLGVMTFVYKLLFADTPPSEKTERQ